MRDVDPPSETFFECEKNFASKKRDEFTCRCFYEIATGYGKHEEAMSRLEAHLVDQPDEPCLLLMLGRLERLQGLETAEQRLHAAAEGYARRAQVAGEVYARINLTDLLSQQEDEPAARHQLELAAAAARRAGDATLLAEAQVRQARLWVRQGENLDRVERLLREVVERAFPHAHNSLQRDILAALGEVLHHLGRHTEAEEQYRRMIEVTQRKNRSGGTDLYGEATARQNLAILSIARPPAAGLRERSIELFRSALAAAERAGQRHAEADAARWLGWLLGGEEGRRELERAVELARALGDPILERLALATLAAQIVDGDPEHARGLIEQAAALSIDPEAPTDRLYGWFDRLKVVWSTSPRAEALAQAREELRLIEKLRGLQTNDLTRAEIFSVWADAYSWLAGRLLETADATELGEAFELLERRHARVLLEAARTVEPEPFASLEQVQATLGEQEALLVFQQAYEHDVAGDFAGGSWLLLITQTGARVIKIADPLTVDPVLPTFVSLFARRDGSEIEAAAQLARGLLSEALTGLASSVERLVIVPDEDLHLLPFAALRAAATAPTLAERYELTIVPSATLWRRWRRAAMAPATPAVLALADPELAAGGSAPAASERGWDLEEGRPLGALPHARHEGRQAVRWLGGASELRVGKDAAEHALKTADLTRFGLVHFAAHAVVDGERSERSAIVLAAGEGEDGLLEPREIRALDLHGKAVVLSACRSAVGDVLAGEGPLSLAHAFFTAGAHTVVASLWPLRDDEAERFFDPFYRHLSRGESVGRALAATQREMIAAGEPASAWAGVVVLGDGEWRISPARAGEIP